MVGRVPRSTTPAGAAPAKHDAQKQCGTTSAVRLLLVPRSYGGYVAARNPSRTFAVPAFPELMSDYANAFTAVELERLLDWFQRLRICRADVPRDYELGDKVARELARLRRPVDQP